jgi:hypothetical protein
MLTTHEVRVDYFILSEKKTGAFFNNSWRISPGGQWRIAAATLLIFFLMTTPLTSMSVRVLVWR